MPASTQRRRYGHGLTALMWAAGHEDGVGARAAIDVVDLLIMRGAPLDAVDDRGRTALMIAAERGDPEVVTALLRHGADPKVKDGERQDGARSCRQRRGARRSGRAIGSTVSPTHKPARYAASAAMSDSEVASMRSVMPGLLPRLLSRNASIVLCR